jgi:glycosyltransferase involved in cell wall biosynthesis
MEDKMKDDLFVSILIPTYNRKDLLKKAIESLFNQTYPKANYEVIVVDDGSTDGTEEMLRELTEKTHCNFRYFKQKNRGPAAARNRGIKNAVGEIIGFTDDDCVASEIWLEKAVHCFKAETIAGVQGTTLPQNDFKRPFTLTGSFFTIEVTEESWNYPTCNMFYRMDALVNVGGFKEDYIVPGPEDIDLAWRIKKQGKKIVFCEDAIVYHAILYLSFINQLKRFKRYIFAPLLFRDHPSLRKNLYFGFLSSKSDIYPIFTILAVIAFALNIFISLDYYVTYAFVLITFLLYGWARVFVDYNFKRFPLRIMAFPMFFIPDLVTICYRIYGSIKYKCLVL